MDIFVLNFVGSCVLFNDLVFGDGLIALKKGKNKVKGVKNEDNLFFEFITIFRKYVMFDVHFKMGQIGFLKLELFKLNQLVITGH